MAWTLPKRRILDEAVKRWAIAREKEQNGGQLWRSELAIATVQQKRDTLGPIILAIKAEHEATKANLTSKDAALAVQIQDAADAATELG